MCTSTGACFCHPQWKGADCSIFDYQYQDTRTFNRSLPFGTGLSLKFFIFPLHDARRYRFRITDGTRKRSNDDLSLRDPMHDRFLFMPVRR
jgi:hypothetical protein